MSDETNLSAELEDMFAVETPVVGASEPVVMPPEQAPQTDARPRDESGRFAPKSVEPPVTAPAPAPSDTQERIDPNQFKGYLDERDKRQAAERARDELQARLKAFEDAQNATPPAPIPSALEDPEGFAAAQAHQRYLDRLDVLFHWSEAMSREKYGDEVTQTVMDWAMAKAKASPAFRDEYAGQKHPVDWAVKQHKRDAFLKEIGDDPEAYKAKLLAEFAASGQHPQTPQTAANPSTLPPPTQSAPTRSLAAASGAGGIASVPMGEFAGLEAAFGNR